MGNKRKAIINEILETERVYFNQNLTELKTLFLDPLNKKIQDDKDPLGVQSTPIVVPTATSPLTIESKDIINTIFSKNIIPLYTLHQNLLQELEKIIKNEKNPSLGTVFLSLIPFMKLYTEYVNNYDLAVATLTELEKSNKKFASFIEGVKSPNGMIFGFSYLYNLLITPVQRIPRYEMLFKELLKNSDEKDSDYKELLLTVENLKGIASEVNEKKRAHENISKLHLLRTQLTGRGKRPNLLKPTTRLIRMGDLRVTLQNENETKASDMDLTCYLLTHGILLVKSEPKKKQQKCISWAKYKNITVKTTETKIVCFKTIPVQNYSHSSSSFVPSSLLNSSNSSNSNSTPSSSFSSSSSSSGSQPPVGPVSYASTLGIGSQLILHFEQTKEDCQAWGNDILNLKSAIKVEETPIHDACKEGNYDSVLSQLGELDLESPQPTPEQTNNANKRDLKGRTPLMVAVKYDQMPIVHLLVEGYRVDVNVQDNRALSILHYAESTGNKKLIAYIENALKGNIHSIPLLDPKSESEKRRSMNKRSSTMKRPWAEKREKEKASEKSENSEPTTIDEINSELEIVYAKIAEYEKNLKSLNERKNMLEYQKQNLEKGTPISRTSSSSSGSSPPGSPKGSRNASPKPSTPPQSAPPSAPSSHSSTPTTPSPLSTSSAPSNSSQGSSIKSRSGLVSARASLYESNPAPSDTNKISGSSQTGSSSGPSPSVPSTGSGLLLSRTSTKVVEIPQVGSFHSYEELSTNPPSTIDVTQREAYLSPQEFEGVMGMSKEQFYALPKWRRVKKKQEVGLF